MAAITIRQLSEETKQQLRERAAAHGRSMEAEARELLLDALSQTPRPQRVDISWLDAFMEFGELLGGEELPIPPRSGPARFVDLSGE